VDDFRRFILNSIVWTGKLKVPANGIQTKLPSLTEFQPVAVEFQPKPSKVEK